VAETFLLAFRQRDRYDMTRADARTWSIPAIIVSGDTSPDTIERLIGLGAAAYLIKPFTSAQLRELIAATGRAAHASPAHVAS